MSRYPARSAGVIQAQGRAKSIDQILGTDLGLGTEQRLGEEMEGEVRGQEPRALSLT